MAEKTTKKSTQQKINVKSKNSTTATNTKITANTKNTKTKDTTKLSTKTYVIIGIILFVIIVIVAIMMFSSYRNKEIKEERRSDQYRSQINAQTQSMDFSKIKEPTNEDKYKLKFGSIDDPYWITSSEEELGKTKQTSGQYAPDTDSPTEEIPYIDSSDFE